MKVENNYNAPRPVKIATALGALAGTTAVIYGLTRGKAVPSTFIGKVQNLEMGIKEGIMLCVGSIAGGYLGGITVDSPRHLKAKTQEASSQLIGNALVPFGCLAIANSFTKHVNKYARAIISISTLIGTTFLGHMIADDVNKEIFENKKHYNVGLKDFATDIDDAMFAASTVLNSKLLYKFTATICPFTYTSLGIMAGLRQDTDKHEKIIYGKLDTQA